MQVMVETNKTRSRSVAAGLEGALLVTELEPQGMRVGSSRLVWGIYDQSGPHSKTKTNE